MAAGHPGSRQSQTISRSRGQRWFASARQPQYRYTRSQPARVVRSVGTTGFPSWTRAVTANRTSSPTDSTRIFCIICRHITDQSILREPKPGRLDRAGAAPNPSFPSMRHGRG